ncbi:hypothetical protein X907_1583 [Glycocaulis alkaliphilus]|uniref:Uncharacterized protein n=1 Tax=Glycocaulis alkaliphilus TaxID=1434191 RepID=A0A3T0E9J2_9PROT|nr:pectate lyase [Glycocaulis alkaliphilus]AZU04115.1 hypothetical protein X907_1583 [Glycocaulis alkaliphilus]GGB75998.1 pectate lyase [Glycocaulis alkaliphilus]
MRTIIAALAAMALMAACSPDPAASGTEESAAPSPAPASERADRARTSDEQAAAALAAAAARPDRVPAAPDIHPLSDEPAPWFVEPGDIPAFPGAEGFGRYAIGGRGGQVFKVTNLNDSGPGSLREAVDAEGPRIVVFDVDGIIQLESPLIIRNDFITIAGQSAPGGGITLRDYDLTVNANHVIIRHIRSRMGNEAGHEDDSISIRGGHHIILDHVSTSWAIDENLSASQSFDPERGGNHLSNVTVQWSIISEGLYDAGHEKGDRGYGSLIRGSHGARYSWINNLWAHNHSRMPRVGNYATPYMDPEGVLFDFRNNVFYNWGHGAETDFWNWTPARDTFDYTAAQGLVSDMLYGREGFDYHHAAGTDLDPASVARYNFVNNAYVQGPQTLGPVIFYMRNVTGRAFFEGNTIDGQLLPQLNIVRSAAPDRTFVDRAFPAGEVTTVSAEEAYERVLARAGASFYRDAIDTRVIEEVRTRTGFIPDSADDVGGWVDVTHGDPRTDSNGDGIPDEWLLSQGIDPTGESRANETDESGYTLIERWLNSLAD